MWVFRVIQGVAIVMMVLLVNGCTAPPNDHNAIPEADTQSAVQDPQTLPIESPSAVPDLPFPDNADPALCGIPVQWNQSDLAYLYGYYDDQLIQPEIFLYDSHLRREVVGKSPHGTQVQILLSQSNPTLDYYFIKVIGGDVVIEGWVPAPFVTFEPPQNGA
jgi:hypothetical protein